MEPPKIPTAQTPADGISSGDPKPRKESFAMKSISKQILAVVFSSVLVISGCPVKDGGSTSKTALDDRRYFSRPMTFKNLTVWPIHTSQPLESGKFLTLKEAEERGLAVAKEVDAGQPDQVAGGLPVARQEEAAVSDTEIETAQTEGEATAREVAELLQALRGVSASVGSLAIENKGDLPILVCAGSVLKGDKQDRQIGQDIVVAPGTTVPVDAFCVENGRWTASRDGIDTLGLLHCADSVAPAEVRSSGQYSRDQSKVWKRVAKMNTLADTDTTTGTLLAAIEGVDEETSKEREEYQRTVLKHSRKISKTEPVVGFAYAVNGKPVSVRTFANSALFKSHFESFLTSMSIEASLAFRELSDDEKSKVMAEASLKDVLDMVTKINAADEVVSSTKAANRNGLRKSEWGGNSNCYVETDGESIALTQDWTREAAK